jgi:Uma2 family endonuclease
MTVSALPLAPEQRTLLTEVRWSTYLALLADLRKRRGTRLAYCRGRLEIVTTSEAHERWKKLLARMVEALTEELGLECLSLGQTTWRREDLECGIEPDECYYIAGEPKVRDQDAIDLAVDPPPDLAIEVEISRSAVDRLEIYAALGVPEVWRFDGQTIRVHRLRAGRYVESSRSRSFPGLPIAELARFAALRRSMGETRLLKAFRVWVRQRLGGR